MLGLPAAAFQVRPERGFFFFFSGNENLDGPNMVLKNLLRRKGRTFLTILGISIGVAAIIGLGALADGLEDGYNAMFSGSQADLVLSQPNSFDISYSVVDEAVADELRAMPEVDRISGMLSGFVQAEDLPFFFVFGYPEDSFVLERFQMVAGISLKDRQAERAPGKPILIGSAAAETLKKSVGDSLRLGASVYRVIGIYQTGDAFEDSGCILGLKNAQDLLGKPRQVSLYYIQLKDQALKERLMSRAARLWPELQLTTTGDFSDKQVFSDFMRGYMWAIAGLAILIGAVGMMNAQLMAVFERTREIGVLRAIGWSSRRVLGMILSESVVVCLLGGAAGVGLGYLALDLFSGVAGVFGARAAISNAQLVQAFSVVLTLGLLGGLYPAWRAARLEPVEALRYEGGSSRTVHRLPLGGMAVQSLWQRSTRTLLTLGAIGLTVGAIMALEGVMRSASDSMTQLALGSDAEIMLRQADIADTSLSAIDERTGDRIAALPEVQSVSGILFTAVMLPENQGFFLLFGYAPNEFAIQRFRMIEGRRLTSNRQIILGKTMAEALKKHTGDTIEVGGNRFRIAGVYESDISWEQLGGVVTLRDAQLFMGRPRKVTMYSVKLKDPRQAQAVVQQINSRYPDVHAALSGEFAEQMPDFQNSSAMMGGISFLAILVGGVGVMNTMLMAVLERTREIGVLRALGWRSRAVLGLILREALLLGFLGGVAGVLLAFGLVFALKQVPAMGELFAVNWEWDIFARAFTVAGLLGIVGGLYPALRATRLQPVEALRYE
jgi:ABC-type antimicrobial peptide transport system permease subunit